MSDRIVFVGGVDVSHACLEALCELGRQPALAVTYDESRRRASGFVDLGALSERYGFDLVRTGDINDPRLVERIAALEPALLYVIGWSQLIGPSLLAVPARGCVGIHPTKLPQGRGRAPVPWTILKRLEETASSMFFLTEGVDDGDVVEQIAFAVDGREDAGTLYAKHLAAHVELVRRQTGPLLAGTAVATAQDPDQATYWPRRTPENGRIDWNQPAEAIDRLVRALTRPYPGAFTDTEAGRITIWRTELCGDSLRILEAEIRE